METFGTALLRAQNVGDYALLGAVAMQQAADTNLRVDITDADLMVFVKRLLGHATTVKFVARARKEAVESGLVVSATQVRPLDSLTMAGISRAEAERLYPEQMRDDGRTAKIADDASLPQRRLYGGLMACGMHWGCMKTMRTVLRDAQGESVIVDGHLQKTTRLVWNYSFAAGLLDTHGIDYILDRAYEVWAQKKRRPWLEVDASDPGIKATLIQHQQYLVKVLGGTGGAARRSTGIEQRF
jgi:hypothetical protein